MVNAWVGSIADLVGTGALIFRDLVIVRPFFDWSFGLAVLLIGVDDSWVPAQTHDGVPGLRNQTAVWNGEVGI